MSIDKSQISNHKLKLAAVQLPISKSIANRLLLLQAIHGDSLLRVSSDMPDDVIVLHDALARLREHKKGEPLTLYLKNCGTALRFLQVHIAKCYSGEPITLTGDPRLMERDGKPTSQTISAKILHGENIPVEEDESPYIKMSRVLAEKYSISNVQCPIEACWSSASYWYEYIAIHGGELLLEGLKADSLQGDKIVGEIYAKYFGVETTFVDGGAKIKKLPITNHQSPIAIDFSNCIDLYPAIALTCERLGIELQSTGTERLRYKESDRIEAVRLHEVREDHRMAMALLAAGYINPTPSTPEEKEIKRIIAKSYPAFISQLHSILMSKEHGSLLSHITPMRGVNDDNLGKKHALSKLIHAAEGEYIWMHDDDVVLPPAATNHNLTFPEGKEQSTDLIILPLRMESEHSNPSILERLQKAEYGAIQELTMLSAKRGHAVMCSGANLIVRREVWLACEGELHPEIPSGDDMFLLEAVKRRGYTIGVIDNRDYTAVVRPVTSWRAFFRQRMRWAGKAPRYTDKDILCCGILVAGVNILQILCPLIILIKFPIEYSLIYRREASIDKHKTTWYVALLLEIVYPFYMLISFLGGIFRKEW